MPFATCNNIRLFYELHGHGEPLVLLCGLGGDHTFWQPSLPVLGAHYQVLVFDPRGSGQSETPEAPYTMAQLADDLAGLLDALGWPSAHVLGFSMGGNVALTFALQFPARVRKLVLGATYAVMNPQVRLFLDAVLEVYAHGATPRQMFQLIAPWLFSTAFLTRPEAATLLQFAEDEPYPQPLYAWRNQYAAQRAFDLVAQLPQLAVPTLILAGGHDRLAHPEDAQLLARHLPQAELVLLPEAGHLLNYEQPVQFHAAVLRFLS